MTAITTTTPTMSSREIAEIMEKRHSDVCRDIRTMLEQVEEDARKFAHIYRDAQNREQTEYRLDRRLTLNLITGYDAKRRLRVIDKLEELERQTATPGFAVPRTLSEALLLAAEQAERIETLAPKAAALDRLSGSDGSLCITDAAKAVGVRPGDLFRWMRTEGWIYRRTGSSHDVAYQSRITQGVLEHKTTTVVRSDGSERITEQVRVTPKGVAALASTFGGGLI